MIPNSLGHFKRFVMGLAVLCLILCAKPAQADASDVVTLNFTGNFVCDPSTPACAPSSGTVTGAFSVDPDTGLVVGPWSFSAPFGVLSSSGTGALATIFYQYSDGSSGPLGSGTGTVTSIGMEFDSGIGFLEVFFQPSVVPGEGAFIPGPLNLDGISFLNGLGFCTGSSSSGCEVYDFTSASAASTTPEPSSLLLFGTGLLGLGAAVRRFSIS